jgi:hypothetical protein
MEAFRNGKIPDATLKYHSIDDGILMFANIQYGVRSIHIHDEQITLMSPRPQAELFGKLNAIISDSMRKLVDHLSGEPKPGDQEFYDYTFTVLKSKIFYTITNA